jgi:uncharacterized protein (DUF1800 family)
MSSALLDPIRALEWDERKARHLLNRAGFGVPRSVAAELAALDPESAVNVFVDYERFDAKLTDPDFLVTPEDPRELRDAFRSMTEEERHEYRTMRKRRELAALGMLKAWWLERMTWSDRPLEEKLALFWHGHFAASSQKVRSSYATYHMNAAFRDHAAGNLKALTLAVGQSPMMLRYLDNNRSTKEHPNENWARELMELFTLGQGQYSEDDIKNSARAFTGWTFDHRGFQYREAVHDFDLKRFMGHSGNFDGWDIIDIIFEQRAASEFISEKLWRFFAYEEVDRGTVAGLAATLRGNNYELRPMLRQLFLSRGFYSEKAMGTQIKSPAQLMVELAHDMQLDPAPYSQLARASAQLGQDLFFPPNVKGWDGGRAWVNANSMLIRYNLPAQLASASDRHVRQLMAFDPNEMGGGMMGRGMAEMMQESASVQEYVYSQQERALQRLASVMPSSERQEFVEEIRLASAAERRKLLKRLAKQYPRAGKWDAAAMFAGLHFRTAGECADGLASRYLNRDLTPTQRAILVQALGAVEGADVPMVHGALSEAKMQQTLHLLMSMAEYQLC